MGKAILILLLIVSIEFNLQFNGFEHEPNWVRVLDEQGQEVQVVDEWQKIDSVYYWNIYLDGELLTFLNFWQSY